MCGEDLRVKTTSTAQLGEAVTSGKPRILFVDDEANILQGLRRSLHPMAQEWAMEFAQGSEAALAILAANPVDVIVTDMRMPGMDGAELLTKVRKAWPQVTRIILSAHSDQENVLRSINAAHQFLVKPCDPDLLRSIIARAFKLRDLVTRPSLRSLIAKLNHVPSVPELYAQINAALADKASSVRDIGDIVARDVGFSIKLLQIVNSAFFGLSRRLTSASEATVLLGVDIVRSIVLSTKVFASLQANAPATGAITTLWHRGMRTGDCARILARKMGLVRREVDAAFFAGLVHDVGYLLLRVNLPDECARCSVLASTEGITQGEAEIRVFGVANEGIAASLLGTWGLPDTIVEAIAYMHRPSESLTQVPSPLTALHLAEVFDHVGDGSASGKLELDEAYLARVGLTDVVAAWFEDLQTHIEAMQGVS